MALGAKIRAECIGDGASGDAHHPTAPAEDGRGAESAMRGAIAESGTPNVDYVNAHGPGTLLNDSAETKAIISAKVCVSVAALPRLYSRPLTRATISN